MDKKRFAVVGASGRAWGMFVDPITKKFAETAEIVALCDISQARMDYFNQQIGVPLPTYRDCGRMLKEQDFDTLIVVTQDSVHHEYIIQGVEAGKDVITEKPMTTDDAKCRAILAAEKRTGRKIIVTFNFRFTPPATALHNLVAQGTIGDVVTVDLHWPLDRSHGADYFRRWHGRRKNSGGLQVHKSTHHFDLVNWIIGDEPERVLAQGSLAFYGKNGPYRSQRCLGCPHKRECRFFWDITEDAYYRDFYMAAEKETGYIRDGCVFSDEIDIEDNYSVEVNYRRGVRLSYSLQAFSSWEGFRLEIQGKKGRIEYLERHGGQDGIDPLDRKIVVMLNDGSRQVHTPPKGVGGHGGGDDRLRQMLFVPGQPDPNDCMAGTRDACSSVLIGVAATRSMQSGGSWVRIADLLKGE